MPIPSKLFENQIIKNKELNIFQSLPNKNSSFDGYLFLYKNTGLTSKAVIGTDIQKPTKNEKITSINLNYLGLNDF